MHEMHKGSVHFTKKRANPSTTRNSEALRGKGGAYPLITLNLRDFNRHLDYDQKLKYKVF